MVGLLPGRNEPLEAFVVTSGNDPGLTIIFIIYRMEFCLVFIWRSVFFFLFLQFLVIAVIQRQSGYVFKTPFALAIYNVGYRFGRSI